MKAVLWKIARRSGVFGAWRLGNKYRISILMAHGVMDSRQPAPWQPLWSRVEASHFERALALLGRYYEFVTMSEAARMLSGAAPVRPHCMALTFDDGYRNNLTHALPILERLGIPATFFISTGYVGTGRTFWIDRLDYALQKLPPSTREIAVGPETVPIDTSSRAALASSYQRVRLTLKRVYKEDFDERAEELIADVERRAGASWSQVGRDDPWAAIMSWDEVREAAARGMEIGSHTVDHVRLAYATPEVVRAQLLESREAIERETGRPCVSLAYPSGSYSDLAAQLARETGYQAAVTTDRGLSSVGDGMFALRRFNFPVSASGDKILALASGFQMAVEGWRGAKAG